MPHRVEPPWLATARSRSNSACSESIIGPTSPRTSRRMGSCSDRSSTTSSSAASASPFRPAGTPLLGACGSNCGARRSLRGRLVGGVWRDSPASCPSVEAASDSRDGEPGVAGPASTGGVGVSSWAGVRRADESANDAGCAGRGWPPPCPCGLRGRAGPCRARRLSPPRPDRFVCPPLTVHTSYTRRVVRRVGHLCGDSVPDMHAGERDALLRTPCFRRTHHDHVTGHINSLKLSL